MENYHVKIFKSSRRIGIKEVTATSIDQAEAFLLKKLKETFCREENLKNFIQVIHLVKEDFERQIKVEIPGEEKLTMTIWKG
ncbi:hypothetical protein [Sporocytophaga myxococcoides]|uniref:hypothetical protein n=1 Tax=Sporocytophaga myxococcoides TaxID=153721 RepID=UPI00041843F4|nr:hypothetical protein [Sporocytophaga myxococcoides]